ncbi:hypothetical protein O6H91_15G087200 [Diphasiastrum complanatum]|uniref:Uncharacterized protein n=1 Tax=Diphasiastrum complanatum TaxID=34168 RepID=A0ACC2BKN1_DIPCM|nr:hypothetical protein O6H91_15G087200 [Diphasiastrum complanatum]
MTAVCLHNAQTYPAPIRQGVSFFLIRKPCGCGLVSIVTNNKISDGTFLQSSKCIVKRRSRIERPKRFWGISGSNARPRHFRSGQPICGLYHSRNGNSSFPDRLPSFSLLASAIALLQAAALALSCLRRTWACFGQGNKHPKGFPRQLVTGGSNGVGQLLQQGGLGMALLSTSAIAKDHISPVIVSLRANPTFMSGLLAWAIAQLMKVFTTYFVERRWDFKMILGSGGMPSSHSALCVGLTTSVALCHGVSDALFPVCLGFSLIVMYDATGVRRHAGMQAEVLNMIVKDLFQGHPVSEKKLKELLGHTPLQVIAGACLGMLVGYWCSSIPRRSLI